MKLQPQATKEAFLNADNLLDATKSTYKTNGIQME